MTINMLKLEAVSNAKDAVAKESVAVLLDSFTQAQKLLTDAINNSLFLDTWLWDAVIEEAKEKGVIEKHLKSVGQIVWEFKDGSYILWSSNGISAYGKKLSLLRNS